MADSASSLANFSMGKEARRFIPQIWVLWYGYWRNRISKAGSLRWSVAIQLWLRILRMFTFFISTICICSGVLQCRVCLAVVRCCIRLDLLILLFVFFMVWFDDNKCQYIGNIQFQKIWDDRSQVISAITLWNLGKMFQDCCRCFDVSGWTHSRHSGWLDPH